MKKFLPIFIIVFFVGLFFTKTPVFAADPPAQQMQQGATAPDGSWVLDSEVTFIGKNAARSGNLLDFILTNYNWVCVKQAATGQCDNSDNPLRGVWLTTATFIVAPLLLIVILAAAIVIMVTRGRSLTITRFLPRFIIVILLIFISFPILQYFYQFIDSIQGFFLRREIILFGTPFGGNPCPPQCISQKDLLFVGWDYDKFIGLRRVGDLYSESAFISLLLTKLTALTYYVMVGILILRKIILWLFIIVSPIFPLLLMFYPVRNTGKIWIGEFFRWLLYGPLFAIFLNGLVALWRKQIPLSFTPLDPAVKVNETILYPTAINILLGGPRQFVTQTNSVNLTETFALYVVSLLMLWGVIILPWILLQIFLDYASNLGVSDSAVMKNLVNMVNRQNSPSPTGHPPATSGSALSLPFAKKFSMPLPAAPAGMAKEIPISTAKISQATFMPSAQVKAQVLSLASVPLPTMRDIAKYDTSLISNDNSTRNQVQALQKHLQQIGNPASSTSTTERERYTEIHEKLSQESKTGNTLATSILNAASTASKRSSQVSSAQVKNILTQIANPTTASSSVVNREKLSKMNQSLTKAKQEGNTLATAILSVNAKTPESEVVKLQEKIREAREKGEPVGVQLAQLTEKKETIPLVNRVQTVSKEDYEAVKQMWKENYKNLEVPEGMAGTREEWVKDDVAKIDNIIVQLGSHDEEQMNKGMEEVSSILPFLLVGGFSQTEIISYLKAKQDAAKEVTAELAQEEDDKVSVTVKKTATAQQTMSASVSEDSDEESDLTNLSSRPANIINPQVSNEILEMVNLKLPNMRDIAKYETMTLSKDKSKSLEVEKVQEVLRNIANPTGITNASDKERYEKLKEKMIEASQQGNVTAEIILAAANGAIPVSSTVTSAQTKTVLSQIANPSLAASSKDKQRFTSLHDQLTKASQQGNTLATSLLSVKETATKEEVEKLNAQLGEAKAKGESLASSVLSNIAPPISLPVTNRIQTVSQEDYQAVKEMWKENYQNLEIPAGLASTRPEWINNDISKIDSIITQLSSTDQEQVAKGMEEVSSILPFLLVGGFSQTEITAYLKAKQDAAREILTVISQEEDTKITVDRRQTNIKQTMRAAIPQAADEEAMSLAGPTKNIVIPQISEKTLTMANLQLPKLTDIVKYEVRSLTKDKKESERIEKMQSVLVKIGNPASITTPQERAQYENLRQKLGEESLKGNTTADMILSAVSNLEGAVSEINATLVDISTVLQQIANPQSVAYADDRDYYTRLHQYLEKESKEKNNVLAEKILSVNKTTKTSDIQDIKQQLILTKDGTVSLLPQLTTVINDFSTTKKLRSVINQILSPEPVGGKPASATVIKIRKSIDEANKKGDILAASILSVNDKTSDTAIKQIHEKLTEAGKKGDPAAQAIISQVSGPFASSSANRIQEVTPEEYEEAKELWKKAYLQYFVPPGFTEDIKGRIDWISKDSKDIEETIGLLQSTDEEKKDTGIKKVSSILPFLLLGGFSYDEMIEYLQTKLEAGKEALASINDEEDKSIEINVKKEEKPQEMQASEEIEGTDKKN